MTTPTFQLFKGTEDLMGAMAPYFISATLVDEVGLENDELSVELDDEARQLPLPTEDDMLEPVAGYDGGESASLGKFKVQGWGSGWSGGGAEIMRMTARAATFTGEVKAGGARHWDDKTLGDILGDTARAAGLSLAIDPELASVRIPYALRWEASPIDYATRLAEENGAVAKPGGGRLAVVKRGSGKGADGTALPIIRVTRQGSGGWWIDGEPRPRQGTVAAAWINPKTGRREIVRASTGRKGPLHSLIHPRPSEGEAKAAARAHARQLNINTGRGFFIVQFSPSNSAGAMVEASGFGPGIDGLWPSERITTPWVKGQAVLSTIDVTSDPEKKDE